MTEKKFYGNSGNHITFIEYFIYSRMLWFCLDINYVSVYR